MAYTGVWRRNSDASIPAATRPLDDGSASTDGTLIWFGRLDNREYLAQQLDAAHLLEGGDADIARASYARWREHAFARLIGDWACVLCDASQRLLILARDFFGNRSLYYRVEQDRVVWSSGLDVFVDAQFGAAVPANDFLVRYLGSRPTVSQTPLEGVSAVAPGTGVIVSPGQMRSIGLWSPDLHTETRYSRDEEYAEHFWGVFRQAVRDRLRRHRTVWAELSGGLDSSSVVCMAAHLIARGEVDARLQTVSYTFDPRWPEDERVYIRAVEDRVGTRGLHVPEEAFSPFMLDEPESWLSRPIGFGGRPRFVAKRMSEAGGNVLLRGHGGDAVMWGMPSYHPDLCDHIVRGRLLTAHRAARGYSAAGMRTYWDLMWNDGLQAAARRRRPRSVAAGPAWLRATPASGEHEERPAWDRSAPESRRLALRFILDAIEISSLQTYQTCGVPAIGAPFLDRRVVQFMLSVPFDQKLRPGATRWLHRNALGGLLPPEVVGRKWKAGGDGVVSRAIDREWPRLLRLFDGRSHLAERGLVDSRALLKALAQARQGLPEDSAALLRAIALEHWLRAFERRGSRPQPFGPESGATAATAGTATTGTAAAAVTASPVTLPG